MKKILSVLLALLFLVGTLAACQIAEPEVVEAPTPQETPEPQETDEWQTITAERLGFFVDLPTTWQSNEVYIGDPNSRFNISGEGVDGSVAMMFFRSPFALSTLYLSFDEPDVMAHELFVFDDENIGYMVETESAIHWHHIEEGIGILSISLWHEGNREVFSDNKNLILRIIRSVRNNADNAPQSVSEEDITTLASAQSDPTVISSVDLPEGFAGFSLYLSEGYTLQPTPGGDYGFFQVFYNTGAWIMSIAQLTQYATAEEWIYDMIAAINAESYMLTGTGSIRTYERPTAEFPFFAMERHIASVEGREIQRFIRDNGKGGIFFISIFLFTDEWETGHGPHLLEALASFEVLAG
jgi:hypothetical protein